MNTLASGLRESVAASAAATRALAASAAAARAVAAGAAAAIALLAWAAGPAQAADSPPPLRVGILVADGVFNTELIGPYDVFDHAPGFEVFTVAPKKGWLTTAEGLRLMPDHSFADHPPIDVLVIPSFEDYREHLDDEALLAWIRRNARGARWVLSHCWGAFYLGAAGLLDGRHATTYPPDVAALAKRFPAIHVHDGYRFVQDGRFLTSAGGTASYESPLYLVRKLAGEAIARRVARGLVIDDWKQEKLRYLVVSEAGSPSSERQE